MTGPAPAGWDAPGVLGRLAEAPGGDGHALTASTSFGVVTVDVAAGSWVPVVTAARDVLGCTFFDWLTAVDEQDRGLDVVVHLWAPGSRAHLQLRTRLPADGLRVPSLAGVFAGADWCERETAEMFGVTFTGHPRPAPLLLPDGFEGHPLRKEFVLASRVAKAWPGAAEPGGTTARRPARVPGVPEPGTWGPPAAGREQRP